MTATLNAPEIIIVPPLESGFVRPRKITAALLRERNVRYWVVDEFYSEFPLGLPLTMAELSPHIGKLDMSILAEATLYPSAVRVFNDYQYQQSNLHSRRLDRLRQDLWRDADSSAERRAHFEASRALEHQRRNEHVARRYLSLMRLYGLPIPEGHECATEALPVASVVPQKVPLRKITTRALLALGACSERRPFTEMFPRGLVPTEETAIQAIPAMNMNWAGSTLLDETGHRKWSPEYDRLRVARRAGIDKALQDFHPRWGENNAPHASIEAYNAEVGRVNRVYQEQVGKLFYRLFKTHPRLVSRYSVAAAYDRKRVMERYTDEDL